MAPPPPAPATPVPAAEPEPTPAPAKVAPVPAPPAAPPSATEGAAEPPAPGPATLPATAERRGKDAEDPNTVYRWVDEHGVLHYGVGDDVPAAHRSSARVVDSTLSVVASEPMAQPLPPPVPVETLPEGPSETAPRPAAAAPGVKPELDAEGLPVPGTMQDTAATRAAKAAGEMQLDPASVERRHQEELRNMNCKEKDGVWICG